MDSLHLAIAVEFGFNLLGALLLWKLALSPKARRPPPAIRLADWGIPPSEFLIFLALAMLGAWLFPAVLFAALKHSSVDSDQRLVLGGAAMEAGVLSGAALFYRFVAGVRPKIPESIGSCLGSGFATFFLALPVVNAISIVWQAILGACGVPAVKQEMVDLLVNTGSPLARNVLIFLATVGAPLMEEVVFRAGIFRFLRTFLPRLSAHATEQASGGGFWFGPRLARSTALIVPAALFAAAHGSLTFFAPLLALGIVFSLAYERTGRIGTTVVAHCLFNLNTIVLVLAGLDT